jgi:hypothetical protein
MRRTSRFRRVGSSALRRNLRAAGDHRQEVIEVVSDAARELADRLQLLG